jgi:phosphoribosylaminoimidazole-succinocarboxamide synthase (EC 6.3.2.6)
MELIRKGKVKEVYDFDQDRLLFIFTNQISVFDKIIPSLIPKKGESLARTSAFWFNRASKLGIKNHFISLENGINMFVKKFKIPSGRISKNEKNYLIPLEFVSRYYVAGTLFDRIKNGKTSYRDIGFKSMPKYGEKLPQPLYEITTKFEKTDRLISYEEAMEIGGLEKGEIEVIFDIISKMDEEIQREVSRRGLIHVDGKKEFALDNERSPYLVDTFGTADEDRWWDLENFERGNILELSKEFVRQHYRSIGYYDKLMEARAKGLKEPDIPPLPPDMVLRVSDLYVKMFERITGQNW